MANDERSPDELWRHFSLTQGGPVHRAAQRLGLGKHPCWLGVPFLLILWVPLSLLAWIDGPGEPGVVPFLKSYGTHARFLVAIPLFFFAEGVFNNRVRQALRVMVEAGTVPEAQRQKLRSLLQRVASWRDSGYVEAALITLTVVLVWRGIAGDLPQDVPSWRVRDGERTMAGWWYSVAALPLFQFLIGRWMVRLLLWGYLLWHFSRLELRLVPTHPDLSGGLGGLGVAHVDLAPLGLALSATAVGTLAEEIAYRGSDVNASLPLLAGLVVGLTLVLIAPLFIFLPRLVTTRQRGLIEYGRIAARYVNAFDDKWIVGKEPASEPFLGSADIQSLADLSNSYEVIGRMRFIPISLRQLAFLVGAIAVPLAPLVLFVISFNDLIVKGLHALLQF